MASASHTVEVPSSTELIARPATDSPAAETDSSAVDESRRDVDRLLAGLLVVIATMSVTVASGWRRHAPAAVVPAAAAAASFLGSSAQTWASGDSEAEKTWNTFDDRGTTRDDDGFFENDEVDLFISDTGNR